MLIGLINEGFFVALCNNNKFPIKENVTIADI